jgi:DNA-binding NarL/FixJ family response regulator
MAGRGRVPAVSIELSDLERGELEGLSRRRRTAQGLARRAQIVLAAAGGLENQQIAAHVGSAPGTVGKYGGAGLRSAGLPGSTTSLARARRGGSATMRSP